MLRLVRHVRLQVRLLIGFGIVCALLGSMTWVGWQSAGEQVRLAEQISRLQTLTRDVMQLKFRNADLSAWQMAYARDVTFIGGRAATADASPNRRGFLDVATALNTELAAVRLDDLSPAEATLFSQIRAYFAIYINIDKQIIDLFRQETPESIKYGNDLAVGAGYDAYYKILTATNKLVDSVRARSEAAQHRAADSAARSQTVLLIGFVLALLLSAGISLVTTRSIVGPMRRAVDGLRTLAERDLSTALPTDGRDELAEMARAFNQAKSLLGATLAERDALTDQLRQLAFRDNLTGLANRALFYDRLDLALNRARRNGTRLSVIMVDLDDFKPVNDRHGHAAGDAVLQEVAARLTACAREADTVARLGGDEFAILVEHAPSQDVAGRLAERIVAALERPIAVAGTEVHVGGSVGVAVDTTGRFTAGHLIDAADAAMYAAKRRGKSTYAVAGAALPTVPKAA